MTTQFELPINVKVGDKIVINDFEEHKTWLETVTEEPKMTETGDRVTVWTDKRLLMCDPSIKVSIRR